MEQWFLSLDKDIKLDMLKECKTLGEFLALSMTLLDASISDGGISTEEIMAVKPTIFNN